MSAVEHRPDRNAERIERRRNVRLLHGEGLSVRAIARRLGIGVATVHRDLVAIGGRPAPPANLPPAPEGNSRALTHGQESPRVVGAVIEPRARELVPQIVEAHGHLDARRDGPAVLRLAMVYARLEHAYAWLAQQGDELFADRKAGKVHGLLGRVGIWEAAAGREEERLAISPRERTRLKLDKLGLARGVLGDGGDRHDFSALTDDELAELIRLREKAGAADFTVNGAEAMT
jgi:hypothetical protein